MADTYLLISDPPHGEVDPQAVARAFGFTAAEALMRIRFPAPELWFADGDLDALQGRGTTLQAAGARVRIIRGGLLQSVPSEANLTSFSFGEDALDLTLESGEGMTAPYRAHLVGVNRRFQTEAGVPGTSGRSASAGAGKFGMSGSASTPGAMASQEASQDTTDRTTVDFYFVSDSRVQRATLQPGTADFSALGSEIDEAEPTNRATFIAQLTSRFRQTDLDERLLDVPVPKPLMVGGRGLPAILGDIDPALKDMTMPDLLSRLAMLSNL